MTEGTVNGILRNYNLEHFTAAADPEGNPLMVTKYGMVSDTEFLDPSTGRVLNFDHKTRAFTGETGQRQELDDAVGAYREAFSKSCGTYLEGHFKKGKGTCTVYGTDTGDIHVCISALNSKLAAFWTGGWRSEYTLNVSSKGETELTGNIKVNVHYFEAGNVQLNTDIDKKATITVGDPAKTGEAVAKAILDIESSFQNSLEEMYVNMTPTFKNMRRFLPISGQNMNWNMAAHSALK